MSSKNGDSWLGFSQSYLNLARLACQELLSERNEKYTKVYGNNLDEFNSIKYGIPDLFIPIVYNIKHGIEIFIKTLTIILSDKIDKNHDSFELFNAFKNEMKKHERKLIEIIREKHEKDFQNVNLQIAYSDKVKIPDYVDRLEKLVRKYYFCEILKDKIKKSFVIKDIDNTTFRYPENNLKITIDYPKILGRINKDEIKEIFEDVDQLLDNFNNLGFVLNIYKQYVKK